MTTFDDDFVRLTDEAGNNLNVACKVLGLNWPPPVQIEVDGATWERESYSDIADDQRAGMTHVVRGAQYRPHRSAT
jgi:hypothetical protein